MTVLKICLAGPYKEEQLKQQIESVARKAVSLKIRRGRFGVLVFGKVQEIPIFYGILSNRTKNSFWNAFLYVMKCLLNSVTSNCVRCFFEKFGLHDRGIIKLACSEAVCYK